MGLLKPGHKASCQGKARYCYGSPDLEDFFSNAKDFTAVVFDDGIRHISIRFDNVEAFEAFLGQNKWINEMTSIGGKVKKISELHILFDLGKINLFNCYIDYDGNFQTFRFVAGVSEIKLKMLKSTMPHYRIGSCGVYSRHICSPCQS